MTKMIFLSCTGISQNMTAKLHLGLNYHAQYFLKFTILPILFQIYIIYLCPIVGKENYPPYLIKYNCKADANSIL